MNDKLFKHAILHRQLGPQQLVEETLSNNQGILSDKGALCIDTGVFKGRSPKDKFIVYDIQTSIAVNWDDSFNHQIQQAEYDLLKSAMLSYLDQRTELWVRTCYACAHPDYHLEIEVINEFPSSNLFAYNMFLRPEQLESNHNIGKWTVLQAPGFKASPEVHGTRSGNFSIISFSDSTILIGGSGYTGEMKKGIFSVLNFLLPEHFNVLPMHCSANVSDEGEVALFFGLSGTGKTTLSTDPNRKLIGDDEHGWDNNSVFNFEGGCYAKTIGLNPSYEPEIYNAIKPGALVENIEFITGTTEIDFNNGKQTENTRVSYPLNFINNIAQPSRAGIPKTIFFLTCDASGVLPPISKLTIPQAKYYF
ncbi:MAG: phosphoenolpyruvate carboxykinase (ATP), partial [Pedobacter sp.]